MRKLTGWSVRASSGKYAGPSGSSATSSSRSASTPSPVIALTGCSAWKSPSFATCEMRSAIVAGREPVDLVERDHRGPPAAEHARRDEAVARPRLAARVEHEQHRVDVGEALVDGALHLLGQGVARPLEARKVREHELRARRVHDAEHAPPRRLRLVRDDRDVVAAERVRQRRLADVRPAGEPDEPAVERRLLGSWRAVLGLLVHASRADDAASGSSTSSVSTTTSPSYRCTTGIAGANSAST